MRRELAYALHKRAQISCVAILDFDGANETFKQLLKELDVASYQYKCLTATWSLLNQAEKVPKRCLLKYVNKLNLYSYNSLIQGRHHCSSNQIE